MATGFDVRALLDAGVAEFYREEDWVSSHAGALSASGLGGCLRREKFRLIGAPREDNLNERQKRRMLAGRMFGELEYRKLRKANRRPKREVECKVEIEGMTILGHADLVMPEGVVEIKTTERHSVHRDWLPFANVIQLGTYMYALDKPGQLLYVMDMGGTEETFDFPSIPEVWEPHVRLVAKLFNDHPGDDVTPYPCERMWCESCPYLQICPADAGPGEEEALDEGQRGLLEQALVRYQEAKSAATSAGKVQKTAEADVLAFRERLGRDVKGNTFFRMAGWTLSIRDQSRACLDQNAARAALLSLGKEVPEKISEFAVLSVKKTD